MMTMRILSVGPIVVLLALNLALLLCAVSPAGGWPLPWPPGLVAASLFAVSAIVAIAATARLEATLIRPLRTLAGEAPLIATGGQAVPVEVRTGIAELIAVAVTIESLRHAALAAGAQDAQTETERAHRAEILRTLDRPLRHLEAGAAALCHLGQAAASRLAESVTRLSALGPAGQDIAEPLAEAAASVAAEGSAMFAARDRMAAAVRAMRSSPDPTGQASHERRSSELLRARALTLMDIVSSFSTIVGRINRPSLAAMGTVVAEQQRLGEPDLIRELSDQIASIAEGLAREVGGLHGALRDVVTAVERLARRPISETQSIRLAGPVSVPWNEAA